MEHRQIDRVKLLDCDLPKVVLAGPLSRDTQFTLHIAGPWTPEMCQRMIDMLSQQKPWLAPTTPPATEKGARDATSTADGDNFYVAEEVMEVGR